MSRAPTEVDRVERVARAVCSARCFRLEMFRRPCLLPDGSDGPCEATQAQLILNWRWHAAVRALEAADAR